eukprot:TRINITY_DN16785_c0_g1_i3.p1 TRINITY_DN16785_c0_g1~~TRINITY_DN16785_c0_g1_i3.p1  ORF type:complete len:190 (+),score=79.96 TRINITY_DN16785_c0_g1_i3:119-688(+)
MCIRDRYQRRVRGPQTASMSAEQQPPASPPEDNEPTRAVADVGFMPQTPEENLRAAIMLKEEGNGYFKAGNLKDATTCYKHMNLYLRHLDSSGGDKMGGMGKMMGGDERDASKKLTTEQQEQVKALLVAMNNNLSMIYIKLTKYKHAVNACNETLKRDAENPKALFNRAKAHTLSGNCLLYTSPSPRDS